MSPEAEALVEAAGGLEVRALAEQEALAASAQRQREEQALQVRPRQRTLAREVAEEVAAETARRLQVTEERAATEAPVTFVSTVSRRMLWTNRHSFNSQRPSVPQ
jgi:hypothetical protein